MYVFNVRGNARTQGEERRKEGGGIFDAGSRTPVAVTIMVKDPVHVGPCELSYHDIGDYLTREEKLSMIEEFGSIDGMEWQRLTPNAEGDWANQRDPAFDRFIPLGDKETNDAQVVFGIYSLGLVTNRDAWAYNMGRCTLASNMHRLIDAFNADRARYTKACEGKQKEQWPDVEEVIDTDPKRISWTRALKADARRGKVYAFEEASIVTGMYRPFAKQWLYFNRRFNEMVYQQPKLFPTPKHVNVVISVTGIGAAKSFSALVACDP